VFVALSGLAAPAHRWLVVTLGVLAIVAGGFVVVRPGSAVHGARIVFGSFLLIAGCTHLGAAALVSTDRLGEAMRARSTSSRASSFLFAPKLGLAALALFVAVYWCCGAASRSRSR
jgi:hypothetical protein